MSVIDELPPGRGRIKTFVRASRQAAEGLGVHPRASWPKAGRRTWFIRASRRPANRSQSRHEGIREPAADAGAVPRRPAARAAAPPGRRKKSWPRFAPRTFRRCWPPRSSRSAWMCPTRRSCCIENAEQFGLAQLHQLRGRIGRGAHESYCILVAAAKTREARTRLRVLEETTDGFRIAEADLQTARAGRTARPAAKRDAAIPLRRSGHRPGPDPAGPQGGG